MTKDISFKDLHLIDPIQKALTKRGYEVPSPIQAQSIPGLLEGKDLIGIAQTGTGKTASFLLPILNNMGEKYPREIRTLIMAPTRELAAQIGESVSEYGEYLNFKHAVIFGGVSQLRQIQALSKGVDILVATPGRLLDLMDQGKISLKSIEHFVLDEADRMLDMGFVHDIKKIIKRLPSKKQSLFFSATMSPEINSLAKSLLKDPLHVEITAQATTVDRIKQSIFYVDPTSKDELLLRLLNDHDIDKVLVFTRTKHKANKVAMFLNKNGIPSAAIHGNKSQNARTKALSEFKLGIIKVLVATDIAARGIDIDNISHVINFELPNEPESYVHRIGRTARAGTDGVAFSFCAADEKNYHRDIEILIRMQMDVEEHEYHSDFAQNAKGADARPPPRGQSSGERRGSRRNSNNKSKSSSRSKNTSRGNRRSKNNSRRR